MVHRLVVADTVEDRILALQDRKKGLADGSLGEGDGKKLGRKFALSTACVTRSNFCPTGLSVKELANCTSVCLLLLLVTDHVC